MNIVNKHLKKNIYTASDFYKPTNRNHCYLIERKFNPHLENNPISVGDIIKIKYHSKITEVKVKNIECTKNFGVPVYTGVEIEE